MTTSLIVAAMLSSASIQPVQLRCEALENPVGIGTTKPRLSWKLVATNNGKNLTQSHYRILVASSPALLAKGKGDLWDSGEVSSNDTIHLPYQGKPLESRAACWWKVQVRDQDGTLSDWSKPAHWSVGILKPSEWKAKWIGFDAPRLAVDGNSPFQGCFWIWGEGGDKQVNLTKTVKVENNLRKATLNITADDQFKVSINGKKIGQSDGVTDAWKKPKKLDVTAALPSGNHQIEIAGENTGGSAGVLASLVLEYQDGRVEVIRTDKTWKLGNQPATEVGPYGASPWGTPGKESILPAARYLRNEFAVEKKVKRAILHATAQGIFEASINGKPVSEDYFMPGWSSYEARTYICSYDVSKMLKNGTNAMGAILADGWFSGYVGYAGQRDHYGKDLRFAAQLEIEFTDGSTQTVTTGPDWRASTGPIIFSDFLAGETYDARAEHSGWDRAKFDDSKWSKVQVGSNFKTKLEPFPGQPVRAYDELKAKNITEPKPGSYVIDLGQNMAGFARLKIKGKAGQKITLRFAERLNPDGTFYTVNLRGAKATDEYICKGGGVETWSPKFTFHGFQYIEVTGLGRAPKPDEVVGIPITSATPSAGTIETSDPMMNTLVNNALWTQQMNFIDVPTDCPQRDERLGWTGDAQAYIRTAAMYTDVHAFFNKWLASLDDSQRADGQFPMVSPLKVAGDDGGPAWADAGVICPWEIYDIYGDEETLTDHYPAMKRFIEFCRKRSTAELLPPAQFHCFGDWLNINDPTPNEVIYTAYFAGSSRIVSQAAKALGNKAESAEYEKLYQDVRKAFQKAYVSADGKVKGDSQCAYILALAFDLLDEKTTKLAANHLVRRIEENKWHLSTGFVGTRDIMHVLSKIGRNDVAFRILHNKTFPSWGFTIVNGATSIWERWDGWTPERGFQDAGMNSFAHYAFGAVVGWMFAQPGGITNLEPGFGKVKIAPQIDPNMKWMRTSYDSVRGKIVCNWEVTGKTTKLHVEVPPNVQAEVHFGGKVHKVGSGKYDF